jgi:nucleoside-diphosphate-sugar epimerase
MRVLVTGSEGYIGTLLCPYLVAQGHEVVGVDAGFYADAHLYEDDEVRFERRRKDIRRLTSEDLQGFDAVVHMAELSNDPLGQLAPTITYEINHRGSVDLASAAKEAGASRFVYTSSCSVYGAADQELVDEESPLHPQTAYAVCKQRVEQDVAVLADDSFTPTFLRNATARSSTRSTSARRSHGRSKRRSNACTTRSSTSETRTATTASGRSPTSLARCSQIAP